MRRNTTKTRGVVMTRTEEIQTLAVGLTDAGWSNSLACNGQCGSWTCIGLNALVRRLAKRIEDPARAILLHYYAAPTRRVDGHWRWPAKARSQLMRLFVGDDRNLPPGEDRRTPMGRAVAWLLTPRVRIGYRTHEDRYAYPCTDVLLPVRGCRPEGEYGGL